MGTPEIGKNSFLTAIHQVEEFGSRLLAPSVGGVIGAFALAPIPFIGSIAGSVIGSTYALKLHQEHFEGKISKGELAATAAISFASGGMSALSLLYGGFVFGLIGRGAMNAVIGSAGRAAEAYYDGEADTAWSFLRKTLLTYDILGDIILGEAAHRVFGKMHAEALPAYREKTLQQGHFNPKFVENMAKPLSPSPARALGDFVGNTALHGSRRAYWQWASLGADWRGGLIGAADTTATTLRRAGVTLKPAEDMAAKIAELTQLAKTTNRPVIYLTPGHQGAELDILGLPAFTGLPGEESIRISIVSATDSQWGKTRIFLDKKGILDFCYSSLGINRNRHSEAVELMTRRASEGMREGRVAPLILGPGLRGLGLGPLKSGYAEIIMQGVPVPLTRFERIKNLFGRIFNKQEWIKKPELKVPLIGVPTLTGADGFIPGKPHTLYGDFDFFDPTDLGVTAGMEFNKKMRRALDKEVHKIAYKVHQRDLLCLAESEVEEVREQFYRSMASFYPLVKALDQDKVLREAVFKAHAADERYVREVILHEDIIKWYEQAQQTIHPREISFYLVEKNIKNLGVRVKDLGHALAKASPAETNKIIGDINLANDDLKAFSGPVMDFMKSLN